MMKEISNAVNNHEWFWTILSYGRLSLVNYLNQKYHSVDSNTLTMSDSVIRAEAGISVNINMVVKSSITFPCSSQLLTICN